MNIRIIKKKSTRNVQKKYISFAKVFVSVSLIYYTLSSKNYQLTLSANHFTVPFILISRSLSRLAQHSRLLSLRVPSRPKAALFPFPWLPTASFDVIFSNKSSERPSCEVFLSVEKTTPASTNKQTPLFLPTP